MTAVPSIMARGSLVRGWLAGLCAMGVLAGVGMQLFPGLFETRPPVVFVPIALGAWIGARAHQHPNPLRALAADTPWLILFAMAVAAALFGVPLLSAFDVAAGELLSRLPGFANR